MNDLEQLLRTKISTTLIRRAREDRIVELIEMQDEANMSGKFDLSDSCTKEIKRIRGLIQKDEEERLKDGECAYPNPPSSSFCDKCKYTPICEG